MNKRQRIKRAKQVVHAILLGQASDAIAMTDVLGRCGLTVVLRRPGEKRGRWLNEKRPRQ